MMQYNDDCIQGEFLYKANTLPTKEHHSLMRNIHTMDSYATA